MVANELLVEFRVSSRVFFFFPFFSVGLRVGWMNRNYGYNSCSKCHRLYQCTSPADFSVRISFGVVKYLCVLSSSSADEMWACCHTLGAHQPDYGFVCVARLYSSSINWYICMDFSSAYHIQQTAPIQAPIQARVNRFCIISVATSLRSEIYSPCLRFYDKRPCGSFHFDSVILHLFRWLFLYQFFFFERQTISWRRHCHYEKVSTNRLSLIQIPISDQKFHSCYDSILSFSFFNSIFFDLTRKLAKASHCAVSDFWFWWWCASHVLTRRIWHPQCPFSL